MKGGDGAVDKPQEGHNRIMKAGFTWNFETMNQYVKRKYRKEGKSVGEPTR